MSHRFGRLLLAGLIATALCAGAQDVNTKIKKKPQSDNDNGQSSSKDTKIDLSPPGNDAKTHPNSGVADDVLEMHPYNPMKAMKDVEVGDYYYKQKNYLAAISRYREALEYKPYDAVATIALARALEKTDQLDAARTQYESYLKILPNGPSAAEARKALERLPKSAPAPQAKAAEETEEPK